MDFKYAGQPRPPWVYQGMQPEKLKAPDLLFKVRSIRLVGIVLSMFCLVDKVPFLR